NVVVTDNGNAFCSGTVAAGGCSAAPLTAGAHSFVATYQGDANYNASPASTAAAHTVNKADTTAAIVTDNPDPSLRGQQIAVTYSVAVNSPGGGTPTGNVQVTDGTDSCTGTVAAGQCNLTLNTRGNRTLNATYQGDANYNASPASTNASHTVNDPPMFTNGPPPSPGLTGTAYNFTYTATGFPTPTFAVSSGALPHNLTLSTAGVISGTPDIGGVYTGTVKAANGIAPDATQNFSITINQPPAITSANSTTFTAGTAATFNVTASGYPPPTISLTSGSLPSGVSFNAGVLSGTPAPNSYGTHPLTFTASNGIGSDATQNFTLVVNPAPHVGARLVNITKLGGGAYRVDFVGNPGQQYTIQWCGDLALQQWSALGVATADSNGMFFLNDTPAPPTAKRFYRALIPYANDFNSSLGAASLRGTAVWTNQSVMLTDAVASGGAGAVVIDPVAAAGLAGVNVKFNLALGPTTSGTPADGASFALGDLTGAAWGEAGPGTAHSLAVGFDTFNNAGNGSIGIHIWVNGVHLTSNATNPYTSGVLVPVEVNYDATNGLTVKYNNATIFNNTAVPGFTLQKGDGFGIGARIGGANERAVVDDIQLTPY
ncbi:MAG TPA: Ig-like domain repeat protein, partial [Chthoniobacterales bacterium]